MSMDKWIELFEAGDYGKKGVFSEKDLDTAVANFNPSYHNPPVVLGHPKDDASSPAHGWLKAVKREGKKLLGVLDKVSDDLKSSIEAGRYGPLSTGFYRDLNGNGLAIRHIGFLGATPPEVKGLQMATFAEGEFFDLTNNSDGGSVPSQTVKTQPEGDHKMDKVTLTDEQEKSLYEKIMGGLKTLLTTEFKIGGKADATTPATMDPALAATFAEKDAQILELKGKVKSIEDDRAAARKAESVTFAEGLVNDKLILPAQKASYAELAEGKTADQRDALKKSLVKLPDALFAETTAPAGKDGNKLSMAERRKAAFETNKDVFDDQINHFERTGMSRADAERKAFANFNETMTDEDIVTIEASY